MIGGLVDGLSFFVVDKPRDQGRAAANGKAENARPRLTTICKPMTRTQKLQKTSIGRILGLQRAHQSLKFRKTSKPLETSVFEKERPAGKSAADASFQPLKRRSTPPQQREYAGDLIIGVVSMSEGFCGAAGASHALERLFRVSRQRPVQAH